MISIFLIFSFALSASTEWTQLPLELSEVQLFTDSYPEIYYYRPNNYSRASANAKLILTGIPADKSSSFLSKLEFANSANMLVHKFHMPSGNEWDNVRTATGYSYYITADMSQNLEFTITRKVVTANTRVSSTLRETIRWYFLWWQTSMEVKNHWRPLSTAELRNIQTRLETAAAPKIQAMMK